MNIFEFVERNSDFIQQIQNSTMQNSIEQQLYNPVTLYEKMLYSCIRSFFAFVENHGGQATLVWEDFYKFCKDDISRSTSLASAFMSTMMDNKADLKSIDQTVRRYEIAFDNWRVELTDEVKREIKHKRDLIWKTGKARVHQQLSSMKVQQVEEMIQLIPSVVEYCLTGDDFKEHLKRIDDSPKDAFSLLSEASRKEIHTLSRKTTSELQLILQCTLAFMCLLKSTGARSTEISRLKRDDISWYDDPPRLLVHRFTGKTGSKRGMTKDIYTTVVPDKDISKCSLVHLSRYMVLIENEPTCTNYVFGLGFPNKLTGDSRSRLTMIMRRFTSVVETLVVIRNRKGLGKKKLHIFRSVCTRKLSNSSCGADEINLFIGWTTGTMLNYYADPKSFALNSVTPYLLAGRKGKDDYAAAAWHFFDDIDKSQIWYLRIATLAVSAGVNMTGFPVDESIKTKIDAFRAKIIRGEAINSIETPKEKKQRKRIRELEMQVERLTKMHKMVHRAPETPTVDHGSVLVYILDGLVKKSKESTFPETCRLQLEEILFHVDKISNETGKSFGIPLQSKDGKTLAAILLIAGSIELKRDAFDNCGRIVKQSWIVFVRGVRNTNDVVRKISTKSLEDFKKSIFF